MQPPYIGEVLTCTNLPGDDDHHDDDHDDHIPIKEEAIHLASLLNNPKEMYLHYFAGPKIKSTPSMLYNVYHSCDLSIWLQIDLILKN